MKQMHRRISPERNGTSKRRLHDEEAERIAIGTLLNFAPYTANLFERLPDSRVFDARNKLILATARSRHAEGLPFGILEVRQQITDRGLLEQAGGELYFSTLISSAVSPSGVGAQLERLEKFEQLRELFELRRNLDEQLESEDPEEILSDLRLHAERVASVRTTGSKPPLSALFKSALLTAPELASLKIPPRYKMLGHFYHEADLGFIFAPRGGGKTWLAMLIAQARANGGHLGEWEAGERPGKVLYIDGEMHAADSQSRAYAIGMDNPNLVWLHGDLLFEKTEQALNLGMKEHQDAITELCVSGGFTEVILDNISSLVRGMKENDGDDWREAILPWLLELRRRKIAVIAVHHAGRNGEMRGTSQREDHANWIIKITPTGDEERQGAEFVTTFTKLRADPRQCPPLKWKLTTNAVGLLHYQCEPHTSMEALVGHVLAGVSSASDLSELMGVAKGTISKWAKKAEQEGLIKITDRNYLPPI